MDCFLGLSVTFLAMFCPRIADKILPVKPILQESVITALCPCSTRLLLLLPVASTNDRHCTFLWYSTEAS